MLVRRMQAYEEIIRNKIDEKMLADESSGGSLSNMQANFSGDQRMHGGALVYTPLLSHIAKKKGEEGELIKQQRKAAEGRRARGRGRG